MAFTSTMSLAQQLLLHQTTTFSAGMAAVATSRSKMSVSMAAQSRARVTLALPSIALLGKHCKNPAAAGPGDNLSVILQAATAAIIDAVRFCVHRHLPIWPLPHAVMHLVLFATIGIIGVYRPLVGASGGVFAWLRNPIRLRVRAGGCNCLDRAALCIIVTAAGLFQISTCYDPAAISAFLHRGVLSSRVEVWRSQGGSAGHRSRLANVSFDLDEAGRVAMLVVHAVNKPESTELRYQQNQ